MSKIIKTDTDAENAVKWLKKQSLDFILKLAGWTEDEAKDVIIDGIDEVAILRAYIEDQDAALTDYIETKEAA